MIPIVACPKRFPTAMKRPLKAPLRGSPLRAGNFGRTWLSTRAAPTATALQLPVLHAAKSTGNLGGGGSRQLAAAASQQATADVEEEWESDSSPPPRVRIEGDALHGPRPHEWWTGRAPVAGICPGVLRDGSISSLPQLKLQGCSRQALRDYFDNTWTLTEVLFSALQGEGAFSTPPYHELRHPLIFYYGHPAALYINKLRVAGLIKEPLNAYFETIFETGVDEMSWDDLSKNRMEWPSVAQVHAYRRAVYAEVMRVIDEAPAAALQNVSADSPYYALPMAFEHERIHIETSSVLMREMPLHYLHAPREWPSLHPSVPPRPTFDPIAGADYPEENPMLPVAGGRVTLGKPRDFPSFGWDNEYGSRSYEVRPFAASRQKVSNGEFLAFVRDAGYAKRELWSDEGWGWRAFRNAKAPPFWRSQGPSGLHHYVLRTVFDEVPMPWDWPVEVNFHEGEAFARWKSSQTQNNAVSSAANVTGASVNDRDAVSGNDVAGSVCGGSYRLLSELEHHVLRDNGGSSSGGGSSGVNGGMAVDPVLEAPAGGMAADWGVNANMVYGGPSPVTALPPTSGGFHDVFGNVWEWCIDHFAALPGFNINPLYEDFSTPCFDGHHNVIMGGSFMSSGNEASVFSRFHFRRHFHQHAGFRLVSPSAAEPAGNPLTSCTDAPPPYVGWSNPFRSSDPGAKAAAAADADRATSVALASHFAEPSVVEHLPAGVAGAFGYPGRVAALAGRFLAADGLTGMAKVLDVGCGPGGAAFELTRGTAAAVVAVDADKAAIDWAKALQASRCAKIALPRYSGAEMEPLRAAVELGGDVDPLKVHFRQADPMCLPAEYAGFDAVVMHGVLDRVPSPAGLLSRMGGPRGVVRPGGLLVAASAFDWNPAVTPSGAWLSGFLDAATGQEVGDVEGLGRALGSEFELLHREEMPAAVSLSTRKVSLVVATATVWRRRA